MRDPAPAYCLIVNSDLFFRLSLSKLHKYIETMETFKAQATFEKIRKIVHEAHGPQAQSWRPQVAITQRKPEKGGLILR